MFAFKAAVVGAGTMGGQIAQTIAAAGLPVLLKDISQELIDHGLQAARDATAAALAGQVKKGKLTEEAAAAAVEEVLGRITGTLDYSGFGDVDFVIEAVPERIEIKQQVFAELDAVTPGHAILASNSSSLSITEIGEATLRPDKVVGFHYFYPASLMPLIEVIESDDTSHETITAAVTFAQAIRKQPIVCGEVPGFVVNRILIAGVSEVLREQERLGLDIQQIDAALTERKLVPIGPFLLLNALGLDVFQHTAEHLHDSYGDRFYVAGGIAELVASGKLGAKSGGEGVYGPDMSRRLPGDAAPDGDELAERLALKTFVEACLVLEEGIAAHRDIDFGMMAGAGLDPRRGILPPFMRADADGLDTVLERLLTAERKWGEDFAPPVILQRLVAQGRLGSKSGQGFYAYPQPDAEQPAELVALESRDGYAIAWLQNPPMNAISPQLIADLRAVWGHVVAAGEIRALVIASSNPMLFCAGADIKAFTGLDETSGRQFIDDAHGLLREFERSRIVTIAAVNGLAFGGGDELAIACDFRIAARSALFGQPEVKLGIVPGFGGTQRVARLIGAAKALELNLVGDPITADEAGDLGLVTRVVEDHELFDTALHWARRLAGQAPVAVEQIKRVSAKGDLDAGIAAEQDAFAAVFASADARQGIGPFLGKREPRWAGR